MIILILTCDHVQSCPKTAMQAHLLNALQTLRKGYMNTFKSTQEEQADTWCRLLAYKCAELFTAQPRLSAAGGLAHLREAVSKSSTASTAVSSRRMEAARQAECTSGNITKVDACTACTLKSLGRPGTQQYHLRQPHMIQGPNQCRRSQSLFLEQMPALLTVRSAAGSTQA